MTMAKDAEPAVRPVRDTTRRSELAWLASRREVLVAAAIILVIGISTAVHSYFWSSANISFIFADSIVVACLALGESFVMLGRGIDLSVGSIMGMSAIIVGFQIQNHNMTLFPALVFGAAIGIALGLGNALLVGVARLPPIIATLGTFSVYSGLEFVVTNGLQVDTIPNSLTNLGVHTVLPGVPILLVAALPLFIIGAIVLRYTTFGRAIYAVGDDSEAAYRAGIPVQRILFSTYVISGFTAGLAGIVLLIHTSGASSTTGNTDNLNAIAAALIGGTALTGGRGGAFGALIGSVFLSATLTALSYVHVSDIWQPAGVGVLVLLAVIYDSRGNAVRLPRMLRRRRT